MVQKLYGLEFEYERSRSERRYVPPSGYEFPFYVTSDGSLRRDGKEFVLEHPLPLEPAKNAIDIMKRFITEDNKDVLVNSIRTSMHIHMNTRNFSVERRILLFFTLCAFEHFYENMSSLERRGNPFCVPFYHAHRIVFSFSYPVANRYSDVWVHLNESFFNNLNRYMMVSYISNHPTIELRFLDVPVNEEDFEHRKKFLDFLDDAYNFFGVTKTTALSTITPYDILSKLADNWTTIVSKHEEALKASKPYDSIPSELFMAASHIERMFDFVEGDC